MAFGLSRTHVLVFLGVGAGLLTFGGVDDLLSAFANREQQHLTCADLEKGPPESAWVRLSGCRVLAASVAYEERRRRRRIVGSSSSGQIEMVFFPIVDQDNRSTVRVVVASDDPATLAAATALRAKTQAGRYEAYMTLRELAAPLEARPIEGMLRRRYFQSVRPDTVKGLSIPLAPDFELLDLGSTPSFTRALLLTGGGLTCGALFLFVLRSGRERRTAPAAPSYAPTYKQAPTGARLAGLMLLNLPPEAMLDAIESAPPLGTRDEVSARIAELLPGTAFDEHGHATFARPDYSIEIDLGKHEPIQTATLAIAGQASTVAVRRLLRRTGWRIFSPRRGEFVEPEVLGTVLSESGTTGSPEALYVPESQPIAHQPWEATADSARRYSRHIAGLIVLLGVGVTFWLWKPADHIEANERQTIRELEQVASANMSLRVATGAYTSPEVLARPENAPQLGAAALPPLFAAKVRHGYHFELMGEALTERDRSGNIFPIVEPAYRSFVYVARPVERGRTGRRSFAYHSDQTSIYARDDGGVPTPKDTRVSGQ